MASSLSQNIKANLHCFSARCQSVAISLFYHFLGGFNLRVFTKFHLMPDLIFHCSDFMRCRVFVFGRCVQHTRLLKLSRRVGDGDMSINLHNMEWYLRRGSNSRPSAYGADALNQLSYADNLIPFNPNIHPIF